MPLLLAALFLGGCGGSPPDTASTHTTHSTAGSPTSLPSTTKVTAPAGTATTTTASNAPTPVQASDGGLTFEVTYAPSHASVGTAVVFTIVAMATHATGALHYMVAFGDGGKAS